MKDAVAKVVGVILFIPIALVLIWWWGVFPLAQPPVNVLLPGVQATRVGTTPPAVAPPAPSLPGETNSESPDRFRQDWQDIYGPDLNGESEAALRAGHAACLMLATGSTVPDLVFGQTALPPQTAAVLVGLAIRDLCPQHTDLWDDNYLNLGA